MNSATLAALILNARSTGEAIELALKELQKSALSIRTATEGNEAALELLDAVDGELSSIETALSAMNEVAELDSETDEAIEALVTEGKIASGARSRDLEKQVEALTTERDEAVSESEELRKTVAELSSFADAGKAYQEALKADIVELYRILQVGPGEASGEVDAKFAESLVDKVGNDIEMLEHLKGDYERQIQARFPGATVRSSVPEDADTIPGVTTGKEDDDDEAKAPSSKSHSAVVGLHK